MYGSSRDFVAALKVATVRSDSGARRRRRAGSCRCSSSCPSSRSATTLYLYWLGVHHVLGVEAVRAQAEFIGVSITMLGGASALLGAGRVEPRLLLRRPWVAPFAAVTCPAAAPHSCFSRASRPQPVR